MPHKGNEDLHKSHDLSVILTSVPTEELLPDIGKTFTNVAMTCIENLFMQRFKIKHSHCIYLAFPTGPYTPPSTQLADLDTLLTRQAKRPNIFGG